MKNLFLIFFLLVVSCKQLENSFLSTSQLKIKNKTIQVEVANNNETRQKGLMFRKKLAKNHGMLFIFEKPEIQCFWMKNTFIPLTVAFLDINGMIINFADMKPQTEDAHCSKKPSLYVLEMKQNWFEKNNIKVGDQFLNLK